MASPTGEWLTRSHFLVAAPLDPIPVGGIVGAVFGGLFMGVGAIGAFWYFRIRNQAPRADASMGDGYYEASE